jgi:hypothetical protein
MIMQFSARTVLVQNVLCLVIGILILTCDSLVPTVLSIAILIVALIEAQCSEGDGAMNMVHGVPTKHWRFVCISSGRRHGQRRRHGSEQSCTNPMPLRVRSRRGTLIRRSVVIQHVVAQPANQQSSRRGVCPDWLQLLCISL